MKDITFHDSFSPTGATDSVTYENGSFPIFALKPLFPLTSKRVTSAFTFAAGVQWFEAYEAAKQHNRVIVGGFSARGSVGAAGGWVSGGGHSAMAPNYGLGMPNSPRSPDRLGRTHMMTLQAWTTSWR